jgi:hypothetical protein
LFNERGRQCYTSRQNEAKYIPAKPEQVKTTASGVVAQVATAPPNWLLGSVATNGSKTSEGPLLEFVVTDGNSWDKPEAGAMRPCGLWFHCAALSEQEQGGEMQHDAPRRAEFARGSCLLRAF